MSVTVSSGGYYTVTTWYHMANGGRMQDTEHVGLSWPEVHDVVDATLDDFRPGWAIGAGWRQPPLF
jgi:hypothetical protein